MGPAIAFVAANAGTIAAVTSVVGTAASINQSKKAQAAGERQAAAQQKQQEVQATRSRRSAFREVQLKRAQAQARAQALNASQGSGVAGGLSSFSSQLGAGLGYAGQQTALSGLVSQAGIQQQTALTNANMFGSVAGFAMQGMASGLFKNEE